MMRRGIDYVGGLWGGGVGSHSMQVPLSGVRGAHGTLGNPRALSPFGGHIWAPNSATGGTSCKTSKILSGPVPSSHSGV